MSLFALLMEAYDVNADQISGPDWVRTENFYVAAKIPEGTTQDDFRCMLRNLLAERFGLVLSHRTKSVPAYTLVISKYGNKMKQVTAETESGPAYTGPQRLDDDGFPILAPGMPSSSRIADGVQFSTYRTTMAQFARQLGPMIANAEGSDMNSSRPRVIDRTGLSGEWTFTLKFRTLFRLPQWLGRAGGDRSLTASPPGPGGDAPTIFSAVEKQLGLKFVKGTDITIDVLVVDQANRLPAGN